MTCTTSVWWKCVFKCAPDATHRSDNGLLQNVNPSGLESNTSCLLVFAIIQTPPEHPVHNGLQAVRVDPFAPSRISQGARCPPLSVPVYALCCWGTVLCGWTHSTFSARGDTSVLLVRKHSTCVYNIAWRHVQRRTNLYTLSQHVVHKSMNRCVI